MSLFHPNFEAKDSQPLPKSRGSQIFFLLKNHFLVLFFSSLTYFVFTIPLLLLLLSFHFQYTSLLQSENPDANSLFILLLIAGSLFAIALTIVGIGSAGMNGVVAKLMIDNDAAYKDFWIAIKEHWLRFLFYYLILGIFVFLVFATYGVYFYREFNAAMKLISLIIACLFLFLYCLGKPYFLLECFYFENGFFSSIKASIFFGLGGLFLNVALLIASNGLYLAMLFSPIIGISIEMTLEILLGGALTSLLNLEFGMMRLEKTVGIETLGSLYRKGLGPER